MLCSFFFLFNDAGGSSRLLCNGSTRTTTFRSNICTALSNGTNRTAYALWFVLLVNYLSFLYFMGKSRLMFVEVTRHVPLGVRCINVKTLLFVAWMSNSSKGAASTRSSPRQWWTYSRSWPNVSTSSRNWNAQIRRSGSVTWSDSPRPSSRSCWPMPTRLRRNSLNKQKTSEL